MPRFRDEMWAVKASGTNPKAALNVHEAMLAVLMDIRDRLNVLRRCETQKIPADLHAIRHNTARKRRRAK